MENKGNSATTSDPLRKKIGLALLLSGALTLPIVIFAGQDNLDASSISTVSSGNRGIRFLQDEVTHWAVCGRSGRCNEADGLFSEDILHEVRCCSDTLIAGWQQRNGCPYAESSLGGPRGAGCYDNQSFSQAEGICQLVGGRLCTRAELEADCTRGSGCGHDSDLVWSGTECKAAGESCSATAECCGGRVCLGEGHCALDPTPGPTPAPTQRGCPSCLVGRVGHWNFDALVGGYSSSADGTIIERGYSSALAGEDALITGSGTSNPLVADGRFGGALHIPTGTENYANPKSRPSAKPASFVKRSGIGLIWVENDELGANVQPKMTFHALFCIET